LLVATLVNQVGPKWFAMDTGSTQNLINTATAKELTKVRADGETVMRGVQGRAEKVSRADQAELIFAGLRQPNRDMIGTDLDRLNDGVGTAIAGLLGMDALGLLRITIDYRNGALALTPGK